MPFVMLTRVDLCSLSLVTAVLLESVSWTLVINTFSLCFKCMGFSFDKRVYILDFRLNQHSRKGKGSKNVPLMWTGGWTLR